MAALQLVIQYTCRPTHLWAVEMTLNLSPTAPASSFHELQALRYLCLAVYEKISGDRCLTGIVISWGL